MLNSPLAVRMNDGYIDQHVTAKATNLAFTKTAPGGYAFGSVRINLPRTAFRDLGPNDRVWFYDARTGRTVFEGYTQNPGMIDGPAGQGWDLEIVGTKVRAGDTSHPLIYIDRDLSGWSKNTSAAASAVGEQSTDPGETLTTDGLRVGFNPGQPIGTGSKANIAYNGIADAGLEVGAVRAQLKSGKTDSGYQVVLVVRGGTPDELPLGSNISTTLVGANRIVGDHFSGGTNYISFALVRTGGATNVADDATWSWLTDVAVVGRRMDRYGTLLSGATEIISNTYVRADWIVEDLLGRILTMADPVLSTVEAATFQIDQLAYPDGATAQRVLEDLGLYEPDMLWEFLHSTPRGVLFRYRRWPTTTRYEISVDDGYEAPGGEADQRNRIKVYWTDAAGRAQSVTVTSDVPALGSRIIDADSVTLPEGLGSETNAIRVGQEILASKASPPKAAQATVDRRIRDRLTGHDVWPWEIEPGYMVRVRETGDLLRLTEVRYEDSSVSASLTLGEPALSDEQRLARLQREVRRMGGRVA